MKKTILYRPILTTVLVVFLSLFVANAQELHTQSNAASISNENSSTTGWATASGGVLTADATSSYSGSHSMKIVATNGAYGRASFSFDVENGEDYTISIFARSPSNVSPGFYAWAGFSNFSSQVVTNTWQEYTFNLTANATTAKINVYPGLNGNPGDVMYIDHVSISKTGTLPDPNTGGNGPSVWTTGGDNSISFNDGNVGIGYTDPTYKLRVNGQVRANIIAAENSSGQYRVSLNATTDGNITGRNSTDNDNKFLINSRGNTYFNGGNVGIGTTAPQERLQVAGNVFINSGNDTDHIYWNRHILELGTIPGSYNHNTLALKPGGATNGYLKSTLELYNANSETEHEKRVNITSSGNSFFNGGDVAIGTTDAQGWKLAVNGNIRAKEIKVETANWPDYVFKSD